MCIKSKQPEKDSDCLHTGKILHYQPYQEPRYISHYPAVQTLKPVITANPYQQSLMRHDHYFTTLAKQTEGNRPAEKDVADHYMINALDDPLYNVDPNEERIYQSVQDPISEI